MPTITFEQIHSRVAEHYQQPAPVDGPTVALTPLGAATATALRLRRQMTALDASDRAEARDRLTALVADLDTAAWSAFGAALES